MGFNISRKMFFGDHKFTSEEDIVQGAHAAFAMSLEGIFRHRLVDNCLLTNKKDGDDVNNTITKKSAPQEVPLLADIFESKLAQFFENAILKFSLSNNCDIGYSLVSMDVPQIVSRECIMGARRDSAVKVKNPLYMYNPYGVSLLVDRSAVMTEDGDLSLPRLLEHSSSWMTGELCMRYWLDIPCQGECCMECCVGLM